MGISESQLPASGGLQPRGVSIPVAQESGVDLGTAGLAGRAVGQFGQQIAQGGEYVVQAETYRAQKQRAQDVLDETLAHQDFLQRFQAKAAQLQQGDYRTLPEEIQKAGRQLLVDVAYERKLSPTAKGLFQAKAEEAITQHRAKAFGLQTQRLEQDTLFAISTEIQQVQNDAAQANTEGELMLTLGRLQGTLTSAVSAGLVHGDAAAKAYRETETTVRKSWADRAIWANPTAAYQELQGMAQGQRPTTEAFQKLPPETLGFFIGKAAERVRESAALADHETRRQKVALGEQQDKQAINLRTELIQYMPTSSNLQAITGVLDKINQAGTGGQLSVEQHSTLSHLALAFRDTALKPPKQVDDPTVERNLSLMIYLSETPRQFNEAREALAKNASALTPETFGKLFQAADAREDRQHPMNRPGAKEGRRRIMDYANVPLGVSGIPTLKAEEATQLRNALVAFDWAIAKMDSREVDERWQEVAQNAINTYLLSPAFEGEGWETSKLFKPLQTSGPTGKVAPNSWWVQKTLNEQPHMSDAEKGRHLQEYEAWAQTKAGKSILERLYVNPAAQPPPPPPAPPGWGAWFKGFFQGTPTAPQPPAGFQQPGESKAFRPVRNRAGGQP